MVGQLQLTSWEEYRRKWLLPIEKFCLLLSLFHNAFSVPDVMKCQMRSDGCECEPRVVNEVTTCCSEALPWNSTGNRKIN
jgi:hypothetical protein